MVMLSNSSSLSSDSISITGLYSIPSSFMDKIISSSLFLRYTTMVPDVSFTLIIFVNISSTASLARVDTISSPR